MQFSEWFSIVEQSVRTVASKEVTRPEDSASIESGTLSKTPLFVSASNASVRAAARYAYEADAPEQFFQFSCMVASKICLGSIFRDSNSSAPRHWPQPDRVETDWRQCCERYDKLLQRAGYPPIVVAADIEQMVLYEKGPFAKCNVWVGKLLGASILKQNGFAPPLITSKVDHDRAIRGFKSWVTYYETLVRPI